MMAPLQKARWLLVPSQGGQHLFCGMYAYRVGWEEDGVFPLERSWQEPSVLRLGTQKALVSHTSQIPPDA